MLYSKLDAGKLIETIEKLHLRISGRFPGSGLSSVAGELLMIAQQVRKRVERIQRPNLPLRALCGILVMGILVFLFFLIGMVRRVSADVQDLPTLAQFVESGLGGMVLIGAGVIFLVTLENRLKRRHAIDAVYELRVLSHVVDMHQLTKDPDSLTRGPATQHSPRRQLTMFELGRYLDYCVELLSLSSKVGVLYVQGLHDPVVIAAVDQLEDLTNGLSRKIWQKIMILDRMMQGAGGSSGPPSKEEERPAPEGR